VLLLLLKQPLPNRSRIPPSLIHGRHKDECPSPGWKLPIQKTILHSILCHTLATLVLNAPPLEDRLRTAESVLSILHPLAWPISTPTVPMDFTALPDPSTSSTWHTSFASFHAADCLRIAAPFILALWDIAHFLFLVYWVGRKGRHAHDYTACCTVLNTWLRRISLLTSRGMGGGVKHHTRVGRLEGEYRGVLIDSNRGTYFNILSARL
jgi:hypothetical protein